MMRGMIAFLCGGLLMLASASAGYAQAGRRVPPPKSDPPVPKTAEPAPTPVKEKPPERAQISLLVASERSHSMRLPLGTDDILQAAVGRRLQDSKSLKIAAGGEMSRGEASKRAKKDETGTFVVWFEFGGNNFDLDPIGGRTRIEDLSVRYIVLEPATGKIKTQGDVYLRSRNTGILGGGIGRRLPGCYPQAVSNFDYALTEAGIEAAERIIRSFSLPLPPLCS